MIPSIFVSRCKRKKRPYDELKIKSSGGLSDLFDNVMKEAYRITDDEYDYLADNLTDDEVGYFINENLTFGDKKECLRIVERHLSNYYQ